MDNNALMDASQFPGENGGERIQAAIDSWGTKPKVIEVGPQGPDLEGRWFLTKPIILASNTTLILHGARLFMAGGVSDNMIRNFHAETGDNRRDENIHVLGLGGAGAEDYRGSARGSGGFLENIVVSNVSVKNLGAGAVVRTLASKGKNLDGVFISQVAVTGSNQVLKIGWDRWGARQGGRDVGPVFPSCEEQKNIIISGVKGSTDDVFCRIESNVKNLTIKNVRGSCGTAAFTNIGPDGYCFSMENVLLDDWVIEGCRIGVDIGGGVMCSDFTVRDSAFSAAMDQDSTCIRLSGEGKTLEVKRVTFDNVIFDGFSRGLKIGSDVLIRDAVRMINSEC